VATEVRSGLFQLKVPIPNNPLGWVLPYLVPGDDGYTLIDSGWNTPDAFDALEEELRAAGVTFDRIKRLIVTHVHPDHYGLAGRIKEACGAEVIMHQREQDFIRSRYREPEQLLERMAAWLIENGVPRDEMQDLQQSSMPARSFVVPAEPDSVLWGGETLDFGLFKFEVYWTPGHSPGHLCFYEREKRIILTGDHVLPTITPNVSLHPQQMGNPLGDYLASLRRSPEAACGDRAPPRTAAGRDAGNHRRRRRDCVRGRGGRGLDDGHVRYVLALDASRRDQRDARAPGVRGAGRQAASDEGERRGTVRARAGANELKAGLPCGGAVLA